MNRYFQIERKHIVMVQFIIEGYGRMAAVSTVDFQKAIIRIAMMPDFVQEMNGLLEELQIKYKIKEISGYQEN
jgi:hypothetical protein